MFFLYWKKGHNFESRLERLEQAKQELVSNVEESISEVEATIRGLHLEKGKLADILRRAS